jgi:hypothetical protein
MMNNKELKQAILDDIEILKSIEIGIIPAREYYGGLLKLFVGGLWKLGLIVFFTILYASIANPSNPGLAEEPWLELITESAIIAVFMTTVAMILLGSAIAHYYLIRYYLKNRLKTGHLLVNKLKHCGWFFYVIFAVFCLMFASYTQSAAIFLMIGFSFMASALITHLAIRIEMNRVGISTLFTVVNEFFNKDKTTSI